MFERFSESARQTVVQAQHEGRALRHNYIGTEHLLLALLSQEQGGATQVLGDLGIKHRQIREGVIEIIGSGSLVEPDPEALNAIGIDLGEVRRRAEEAFGPGALERAREARAVGALGRKRMRRWSRRQCEAPGFSSGHVRFTPRAKKVLELSLREAIYLGHKRVGAEHILLGLLREAEGVGAQLLHDAGVDYERARRQVIRFLDDAAS